MKQNKALALAALLAFASYTDKSRNVAKRRLPAPILKTARPVEPRITPLPDPRIAADRATKGWALRQLTPFSQILATGTDFAALERELLELRATWAEEGRPGQFTAVIVSAPALYGAPA